MCHLHKFVPMKAMQYWVINIKVHEVHRFQMKVHRHEKIYFFNTLESDIFKVISYMCFHHIE